MKFCARSDLITYLLTPALVGQSGLKRFPILLQGFEAFRVHEVDGLCVNVMLVLGIIGAKHWQPCQESWGHDSRNQLLVGHGLKMAHIKRVNAFRPTFLGSRQK
jgi:hypothetical protein